VLLTRVAKCRALKAGHPACEAKRACASKVAVARKLAVILPPGMWIERHRVQVVIKGGCKSTCIVGKPNSRADQIERGTNVFLPGARAGGEVVLGLADARQSKARFTH